MSVLGDVSHEQHIASLLSTILNKEIKEDPERSQVLCKKCFKLVHELDELQNRVTEIKNEILENHKSCVQKTEIEDDFEVQETKELTDKTMEESNKENEVPKKNSRYTFFR
ncbi:hypothetical protein NQ314_007994 [Rhamnusium bicolor]|uniref:ZAD domain-containing protein n=1 Tax=Rhamnusium bicolor TaxID=1586634 RepID=A0AAV8YEK4_9CUCU|nr:hypothetical protein NQ314_007994 [Rhamnusium bicolor]